MSAEILREAAALMRERAEAATPGPWEALNYDSGLSYRELTSLVITVAMGDQVASCDVAGLIEGPHAAEGNDSYYIASMHPAVALAVADWLDAQADLETDWQTMAGSTTAPALRLALTYLGRQA